MTNRQKGIIPDPFKNGANRHTETKKQPRTNQKQTPAQRDQARALKALKKSQSARQFAQSTQDDKIKAIRALDTEILVKTCHTNDEKRASELSDKRKLKSVLSARRMRVVALLQAYESDPSLLNYEIKTDKLYKPLDACENATEYHALVKLIKNTILTALARESSLLCIQIENINDAINAKNNAKQTTKKQKTLFKAIDSSIKESSSYA